jgi:hypothetical protein
MVFNAQNRWVSELCLSSGIVTTKKNTAFRKMDLFPFSGEGKETPTLLGPSERANLYHCSRSIVILSCVFQFPEYQMDRSPEIQ